MGFLTVCPICREGFHDGRPYTGTSGVVFPSGHPLYQYCDAGLHFECLEGWADRGEFSKGYFEMKRRGFISIGTLLSEGPGWILGCGPAPLDRAPYYVEIDLEGWPCRLYSRWDNWGAFCFGKYKEGLSGQALAAADAAIGGVIRIVPNMSALVSLRTSTLTGNRRNG
jgi:hypothetical protein